jgi:transcription elongation factor GreB
MNSSLKDAQPADDLPEDDEEDGEADEALQLPPGSKFYMRPAGFARLQAELRQLVREERPKVVEIVSWAAGNGDRSENGDYIYGKKRLREIDRRIRFLTKRLENAEVVDPARQQHLEQIFFGATVTYLPDGSGDELVVTLVGVDEADAARGLISFTSPLARALWKKRPGDRLTLRTPGGTQSLEVLEVEYRIGEEG